MDDGALVAAVDASIAWPPLDLPAVACVVLRRSVWSALRVRAEIAIRGATTAILLRHGVRRSTVSHGVGGRGLPPALGNWWETAWGPGGPLPRCLLTPRRDLRRHSVHGL